ncbi:MAG: hypothetical protein ACI4GO_05250, partial [Hominenteromicrobium sp.]
KSFKDFILGILMIAVLGCAAYFIADLLKTEIAPGNIAVQSGDAEITALQRVTSEESKDGGHTDCERFDIQTDAADFPVLHMDKGIVLEATQDPYGEMYYTVYRSDYSELYYRSTFFSYPEESGTYYIVIDTAWGGKKHFFTTQHGFTLIID